MVQRRCRGGRKIAIPWREGVLVVAGVDELATRLVPPQAPSEARNGLWPRVHLGLEHRMALDEQEIFRHYKNVRPLAPRRRLRLDPAGVDVDLMRLWLS